MTTTETKPGALEFTTGDGVRIAYRFEGADDKPVLLLANSIATSMDMWEGQAARLTEHFRLLRYDYRGHGGSDTPEGPYSLDRLGRDVVELLDALRIERVHFLGLSLGGIVAQWMAIYAPERIDRLVLSNTASHLGPTEQWEGLIAAVLQPDSMPEIAEMFMKNWFPASMRKLDHPIVESFRAMVLATRPQGIAGSWAAIRDMDMRRTASLIDRPTLVIAGEQDPVTLPEHGELLAQTIPGAELIVLPTAHLPNVELESAFLEAVTEFLRRL
ncbi:3-oxoadipate enol-lactonase [Paenibacillus albicereus]|uniref:3-oxoadipate enol-lactonase n=1 Tax=Paenibacillus albicereus TaxID=2726185 RepID=A0A6H2GY52_9BACL|nr:3-oxoadipate enol-lactonase [Paenibacillus albicereus]QJC52361.1 3-oxoadipate enol-lactonase [Paenibacillus albicereus]